MTSINDILVVIPARGGSKGIPMKNIKLLNGKPLIQYSIEFALTHFKKEQIIVSTDHKDIQRVAQICGIPTPTLRPRHLAEDDSSTHDVLLNLIKQKKAEGFSFKRVLLLQPTSPFRKSNHLKDILKLTSPNLDMVVSVKESKSNPYFNLFEENESGNLELSKQRDVSGRQYAPKVFEYNGSMYLMNVNSLERMKINEFSKVKKYVMSSLDSIDLDSQIDWDFAELMIKQNQIEID
ncbi:MAG: acylneuraminate cytidylyltransferase family protein [Crocinitomicaceae bacterium]|nr:acylneuraminate cytidylyltransferase family protein [Crocinitomicaceae bacterium]MDG1735213.1 acylneuraminate cytidylyltransferase family protein [Crocinitomicaceae bacterium]